VQNQGEISFTYEQFLALIEVNKQVVEINKKQAFRIEQLEQQLAQFKKMMFGSKHERVELLNSGQLSLDINLGGITPIEPITEDIAYTRTKTKEKAQPNRSPLPADLPRETIEIAPEEDTTGMTLIGHEITEQLEMTPAKFYVKQYKRAKYARPEGNGVAIGKLPEFALPKAIAGSSVLNHLLVSKYVDHLPLHRQIKMFSRIGMTLSDSTVNDWIIGSVNLLTALHDRQTHILLSSAYIQNDETPIKVLDGEKKGQTHRGYFWVSHSPQQKVVVFNYNKGRSAQFPTEFLKDYRGYLQTDGYGVYDTFQQRNGITLVGCMAHARRYFVEASGNDKQRSEYFIAQLQGLYHLEEGLRQSNASSDEILTKRQEVATPILNHLHQWLKENITQVIPQSSIGKAIGYALTRWDKLMQYAQDGVLLIDNNLIENQIRPVAVGRKNYLFCGSHESAQRAAIIYSLLGTCKLNNVNPQDWLLDVLQKLPARKANNIDDLLPQNWNPKLQGVL
jgi:transposase